MIESIGLSELEISGGIKFSDFQHRHRMYRAFDAKIKYRNVKT